MKYARAEAKSHSRATIRGVWAAANVPFRDDGAIDEEGYRPPIWSTGSPISISVDERKRMFDLSVEAAGAQSPRKSLARGRSTGRNFWGRRAAECVPRCSN